MNWVEGKTHYIVDALSRLPVFAPQQEDFPVDDITHCFVINKINGIDSIVNSISHEYEELLQFVRSGQ